MIKIILSIVITFIITSILLLIFLILLSTKIINGNDTYEKFGSAENAPLINDETELVKVYNTPSDSFTNIKGEWICPKYIDTINVYCWGGGSSKNFNNDIANSANNTGIRGNFAKIVMSTTKIDKLKILVGEGGSLINQNNKYVPGIKPYGAVKNDGSGGLSGIFLEDKNNELMGTDKYPRSIAIPVVLVTGGGTSAQKRIPTYIESALEFKCVNTGQCKESRVIYKDFINKERRFCIIYEINGYIKPLKSNIIANRVLIVGGGGGGGMDMGGGGGGGAVRIYNNVTFKKDVQYDVIIGNGGAGATAACTNGQRCDHQFSAALQFIAKNGQDSFIKPVSGDNTFGERGELKAGGGGGGGSSYNGHEMGGAGKNGNSPGGNGGGASGYYHGHGEPQRGGNGGANNSGGGVGFKGGNKAGYRFDHPHGFCSGGGGGAGGEGYSEMKNGGARGGNGLQVNILEPSQRIFWGGGGGGSGYSFEGGNGGSGGGGGGAVGYTQGGLLSYNGNNGKRGCEGPTHAHANCPGGDAGENTGGGGGGGSHYNRNNKGGNGGSGIVIIEFTNLAQFLNLEVRATAKSEELTYDKWHSKAVYLNPNSITNPSLIESSDMDGINEDGFNGNGSYGDTGENVTNEKGKNGAIIISIPFDQYLQHKKNVQYDEAKKKAQEERANKLEQSNRDKIENEKLKKKLVEDQQKLLDNIQQQEAIKKQKDIELRNAENLLRNIEDVCRGLTAEQCRAARSRSVREQQTELLAAKARLELAKQEAINASNLEYTWKNQLKQAIIDARNKEEARTAGDIAEYGNKNYNDNKEYIYNMINSQFVLYNVLNGFNNLQRQNINDNFISHTGNIIISKYKTSSLLEIDIGTNYQRFIKPDDEKYYKFNPTITDIRSLPVGLTNTPENISFERTRGYVIKIRIPNITNKFDLKKYVFKVPFVWRDNKKIMCYTCAVGCWTLYAKSLTSNGRHQYIKLDEKIDTPLNASDYTTDYAGKTNIYTSFIKSTNTSTVSNEFVFVITKLAHYNLSADRSIIPYQPQMMAFSHINYEDYDYKEIFVDLYGNDFQTLQNGNNSPGTPIDIITTNTTFNSANSEW